jgi:hypothetical protein
MRICPNMVTPKMPPWAFVPAYRIQLPTSRSVAVVMMAGLGPPLLRVRMTTGLATQKAKRKPVLIQLMALSETRKYCDAVVDIEEKVSH